MTTFFDPNTASGQQRFWYISGLTSDEFYTESCLLMNLTQLLFHELKEAGYEKIVFYNARKRLYCFDEKSFSLLTGKKIESSQKQAITQSSASNKPNNQQKGLKKGAWGKRPSFAAASALSENRNSAQTSARYVKPTGDSRLHIGMQDNTAILSQFRGMMTDGSHSTVIVIDNADDFLKSLAQEHGWNNFFKEISELNSANHNIMIFVFPDTTNGSILKQEQMTEDEKQLRRLNNITISAPDALEFYHMLHYYRLRHGLQINVRDIPEIAYEISRCIAKISQIQTPADGAASGVRIKMLANLLIKWISSKQVLTVNNCYRLFSQYYPIGKIEPAKEMLEKMIGMESVKKHIVAKYGGITMSEPRDWMKKCVISRLKPHLPPQKNSDFYNIVLTGNPGTGKTTVARLLGQFFAEAGILRIGHLVETDRSGLIAGFVGQTAIKTREKITQALGGVLFIDEAYSITDDEDNPFGKECIDTLVKAMDEFKDDLIVVAAGYPDKMKQFLNGNPGLKRRFRETIYIPDYSPNELFQILEYHMHTRNLRFTEDMREIMPAFCENWISQGDENWGNAGEAVKLAADIETFVNSHRNEIVFEADSQSGEEYAVIKREHIPDDYQKYFIGIESLRSDAVADIMKMPGLHSVKTKIKEIENALIVNNLQNAGHYVFMGAPGTGKTTIARKMGLLFRTHKLLKRGHCIETNAGELVAKVIHNHGDFNKSVKHALDGVLFIDEAYQLMNTQQGLDIIDSLVKFMEDNRKKVCVILAGYESEMTRMLKNANPGLESRVEIIHFDNYSGDELFEILKTMLPTMGFRATDAFMESARRALISCVDTQKENPNFGNARYIRSVFLEDAKNCMNSRLVNQYGRDIPDEQKNLLTDDDIPESFKHSAAQKTEDYRLPESAIISSNGPFTYPDSLPVWERGVVLIETRQSGGKGYGSGAMLTSDGYILTCSHVIHNADKVSVRLKIAGRTDGEISWHPARIIRDDVNCDCALIKIDVLGYPSLSITPENYKIHLTDEIFLLGYPFGVQIANSADDLALSFFGGKISSIQQNNEISRVFVNMEAKSGCSGAPVFSKKTGQIIGILCGSQTSKNGSLIEEINYILPTQEIRQSMFK